MSGKAESLNVAHGGVLGPERWRIPHIFLS